MPELISSMEGGFSETGLRNCFFPNLARIGDYAFNYSQIRALNSENFPKLSEIGYEAFCDSFLHFIDLPNLISTDNSAFSGCKFLKSFSAPKLQEIGKNSFSSC